MDSYSYMSSSEFREFSSAATEFIIEYFEKIRERDVLPSVEPGFLEKLLPEEMPYEPEHWKDIMEDLQNQILPGLTHWQSPNFHAYYPGQTSYPAIVGDMIVSALSVVGFTWMCSPVASELDIIMMNWLGKFLHLPEQFLSSVSDNAGGVFHGSATETILLSCLTAREQKILKIKRENPMMSDSEIRGKLVAYANIQANSTVERIGKMCAVKLRLLESDGNGSLRGVTLKKQVDEDIANGLIPAFCIATLGATGTCAFDNLEEIGPICQDFDIWLHCDAAYAGNAFCLEEYSYLKKGLEFAESLNINLHKWMLSSVACTALWMKDCRLLKNSFNVDRIYLDHDFKEKGFDVRHMQLALTRRFRALRVWFTLRSFGQENIKSFLRKTIALAKRFENHVKSDVRFEVVASNLGLVCFRLIGDCELTKKLLNLLTERKKIYVIPATYRDQIIIRFVVCGFNPEESDIDFAWKEIKETSCQIFLN